MAEKSGSRTHRTRLTRPTGFEDRAPHQGAIPFHLIAHGVRPTACLREGDERQGMLPMSSPIPTTRKSTSCEQQDRVAVLGE